MAPVKYEHLSVQLRKRRPREVAVCVLSHTALSCSSESRLRPASLPAPAPCLGASCSASQTTLITLQPMTLTHGLFAEQTPKIVPEHLLYSSAQAGPRDTDVTGMQMGEIKQFRGSHAQNALGAAGHEASAMQCGTWPPHTRLQPEATLTDTAL